MKTIAVQADPLDYLHPYSDTTLAIAEEANKRGYTIWFYTPQDLCLDQGVLHAFMAPLVNLVLTEDPFYQLGTPQYQNFDNIDVVLVRQDPPFDMNYISTTYLLDFLSTRTRCINPAKAIRDCPEKLLVQSFPEYMPETTICTHISHIEHFIERYASVVIKPLYGHGGNDVYHITQVNKKSLPQILEKMMKNYQKSPVIVQRYLDAVLTKGDKRVIFIDGQVEGYFTRIPPQGEFVSNLVQGGAASKTTLTQREKDICRDVGFRIKQQGIYLAGIDIIDEYITEINITSPTGFRAVEKLQQKNLSAIFWDRL